MTTATLAKEIGKSVIYTVNKKLSFVCEVIDARVVYGKAQYQLKPAHGYGEMWVDATSVIPPK